MAYLSDLVLALSRPETLWQICAGMRIGRSVCLYGIEPVMGAAYFGRVHTL